MKITASQVKELRDRTGAGMMDCRKALVESEGNLDEAVEVLRKAGAAKAAKKAGRVAAEGLVDAEIMDDGTAVLVEVNCETDFVARNESFRSFVGTSKSTVAADGADDVASKVDTERTELVATIGENIQVRRAERFDSSSSNCVRSPRQPNRRDPQDRWRRRLRCAQDLRQGPVLSHCGYEPAVHQPDDVPADVIAQEARIAREQLMAEGKPEAMIDKIIPGKLKRFYKDRCLLNQEAAMGDDGVTNQALLDQLNKASATPVHVGGFVRYELGEGIEKKEDNLAAEVAAMTGGA